MNGLEKSQLDRSKLERTFRMRVPAGMASLIASNASSWVSRQCRSQSQTSHDDHERQLTRKVTTSVVGRFRGNGAQ